MGDYALSEGHLFDNDSDVAISQRLQAEIRAVNAVMRGGDAETIYSQLTERLIEGNLPADAEDIRFVAHSISQGTLQG